MKVTHQIFDSEISESFLNQAILHLKAKDLIQVKFASRRNVKSL